MRSGSVWRAIRAFTRPLIPSIPRSLTPSFPILSFLQLVLLVLPVFGVIAVGVAARRVHWIEGEAETSLIRLVINVCHPCLIFESVAANPALREPSNVLLPPLVGFGVTWGAIQAGLLVARGIGLHVGTGLRTFALAVGITNYGFLPIPIMGGIWGQDSLAVLMVHNVGVEAAIWTVGLLTLSGESLRAGWRRLVSPIVVTLVLAIACNLAGVTPHLPKVLLDTVHALAVCSIPLGLIMTGVSLAGFVDRPRELFHVKVSTAALVFRLGVMPIALILLAKYLPCSVDLKRVILVQGAMPTAMASVMIARLYGGQPQTAAQIVLGTTMVGILTIPLWIKAGIAWLGV